MRRFGSRRAFSQGLLAALSTGALASAQNYPNAPRPPAASYTPPEWQSLVSPGAADLRLLVERFDSDSNLLARFYNQPGSPVAIAKRRELLQAWAQLLPQLPFDSFGLHAKVDFTLLENHLRSELEMLRQEEQRWKEIHPLVPFARQITDLAEARQRVEGLDPAAAASSLRKLDKDLEDLLARVNKTAGHPEEWGLKRSQARRATEALAQLRKTLANWFAFYDGYDPLFSWWVKDPHQKLQSRLEKYEAEVREKLAGLKPGDKDTILGDPVGREALRNELRFAMIPYSPEELLAIGEQEFAWCEAEMKKASRELGYGEDWKKALEYVKTLHVPPGQQTALVRGLAMEAIAFLETNQLVTVPALARDSWRMQMMSPERQRINPFFLGGESIIVSYPTNAMSHEEKMMSMRGNNIHFSRATVHHELIPGHWLQRYSQERYRPYRMVFETPFWIEGWALHWEMLLWDVGFPKTPENRVGMLFWRMHRCARIIFSLNFHLEKMTAAECVDFLVNRVGHERENAAGEVRRSFESYYGSLYQLAYMMGALQLRALHKEIVGAGKMSNRQFHDTILQLNSMPIEMVRASLLGQPPARNFTTSWRYLGNPLTSR